MQHWPFYIIILFKHVGILATPGSDTHLILLHRYDFMGLFKMGLFYNKQVQLNILSTCSQWLQDKLHTLVMFGILYLICLDIHI